jgi:DNA-binding HxlR family transcriptional regulator
MKEIKKSPRLKKRNSCQCPTREILDRIGDKWSILTIITLSNAPKYKYRFSELQRNIEGISQRMLTTTLRHLERDGFIKRYFYPEIPPRTEYELTALGKSIFSTFQQLKTWIESNWPKIKNARDQFDAKKPS